AVLDYWHRRPFPTRRSSDLEARLRAAIAWARFAHNGYLAVLESAETFPEARDFVEIARDHDARAEQHLRRRLVAFMNSNSRASRSEEHTSELQSRGHLVCSH